MNEDDSEDPKLRVLPDDEEVARLEMPARIESGKVEAVRSGAGEDVEVLEVDRLQKLGRKTFRPEVADILDTPEEEVDSEDAWGTSQREAPPLGWFVLAGLLVCGLALWAVIAISKARPEREEVVKEKKELTRDKEKEDKEVKRTLEAMTKAAKGYLGARSIEEKLPFVRHPERVRPLMEKYYRTHEMKVREFLRFDLIRSMGLLNRPFVLGKIALADGGNYRLLLEQTDDGSFRVDWEGDVCFLPMEWTSFMGERPTDPLVMRVYVQRDNFYAFEFRDESKFDCYSLTTRDYDGRLFGYVEKGSETAMAMRRYLSRSAKVGSDFEQPFMLKLRFPSGGHTKNAVWIDSMVGPSWTYVRIPEQAESERGEGSDR